jgi:chaperonin GroES
VTSETLGEIQSPVSERRGDLANSFRAPRSRGGAGRRNELLLSGSKGENMNVHPLSDRVLVKRIEEEETKRGGIIIPDTAKEKPMQGEVISVGPGRLDESGNRVPMELKQGDKVLMGKYSGPQVKIEGDEFVILREDDVLGVIK